MEKTLAAIGMLSIFLITTVMLPAVSVQAAQHDTYANFAAPIASYSLDTGNVQFATAAETKTISLSVSDYAVYKNAYASLNGQPWKQVALSGSSLGGLWLNGSVSAQLSFTANNFSLTQSKLSEERNFIVVYTCSRTAGGTGWACHDGWQIWAVSATLSSAPVHEVTEQNSAEGTRYAS